MTTLQAEEASASLFATLQILVYLQALKSGFSEKFCKDFFVEAQPKDNFQELKKKEQTWRFFEFGFKYGTWKESRL